MLYLNSLPPLNRKRKFHKNQFISLQCKIESSGGDNLMRLRFLILTSDLTQLRD